MSTETIGRLSILADSNQKSERSNGAEAAYGSELPCDTDEQESSTAVIGARLRHARESRHLHLDDAVKALKFSLRQFIALETGEWHLLNGLAFTRGFLRGYAKWLDLDGEQILADATRCGALPEIKTLKTPTTIPLEWMSRRNSRGFPVWGAAVIVFVLFALILSWPNLQRIVSLDAQLTPTVVDTAVAQNGDQIETDFAAENAEMLVGMTNTANLTDLGSLLASIASEQNEITAEENTADEEITVDQTDEVKTNEYALSLTVSAPCWVEIRDQQNRIVMSEVLPAGERLVSLPHEPHTLVVGNSRQVKLSYGGLAVDLLPFIASSGVARLKLLSPGSIEKVSLR